MGTQTLFLVFQYDFFNNAYKIYTAVLHKRKHQQDKNETDCLKPLSMDDTIEGDHVRKGAVYHPPSQRDQRFDMNR